MNEWFDLGFCEMPQFLLDEFVFFLHPLSLLYFLFLKEERHVLLVF